MSTPIQLRRSSASVWQTGNPVLADGELGLETGTRRLKIANRTTPWNNLEYALDEVFTTLEKSKLAEIQRRATAAGVVGDEHARRIGNPHATTAAQIGAEPAGAVAAHAGGTNVHAIGGVTGLQAALDTKPSALSLQKDADGPRQILWGSNAGKTFYVGGHGSADRFPWRGVMAQLYVNVAAPSISASHPISRSSTIAESRRISVKKDRCRRVPRRKSSSTIGTMLSSPLRRQVRLSRSMPALSPVVGSPRPQPTLCFGPRRSTAIRSVYTLPAGESTSFVRAPSGKWEVL